MVTCVAIFQTMAKKEFQEFDIDLYQLKNKQYEYEYRVQDGFFEKFENSLIGKCDATIKVALIKSEHNIVVNYDIRGTMELVCDKSLETYEEPIHVEDKVIYKFGEAYEELSENLIVIRRDTQQINLAQNIYELIAITIPYKKLHPRFRTADDTQEDVLSEGQVIYKSDDDETKGEDNSVDPRWEALLKLRKN